MAGNTLTFPKEGVRDENKQVKQKTYRGLVFDKLFHDKITVGAFLLLFFVGDESAFFVLIAFSLFH